jgi:hypothetical protein
MKPSFGRLFLDYLLRHRSFRRLKSDLRVANFNRRFLRRAAAFPPGAAAAGAEPATFRHAGNAGDVIYSLPAVRALSGGRKAQIFLQTGVPAFYVDGPHPHGDVRLTSASVALLAPLLQAQGYVARCEAWSGQAFAWDLDLVQRSPIRLDRGHIARWYFAVFGIAGDLTQPWLTATPEAGLAEHIVIGRSARYRNPVLDYAFLRRYPRVACVGVESEYRELAQQVPNLEWLRTDDFLQLAGIIAGARLFVGNQSLPFALAEGLKVRRVLEVCPRAPNVIPEGADAYDAYFQPQFEHAVARCLS